MTPALIRLSYLILIAVGVVMLATCFKSPNGRCDFNLRMNELACLRQGVDPYSVWHEDVSLPPYCSNIPKKPVDPRCTEQVNAYVPWAYTAVLPLSFLPRSVAWGVYCALMGLALWAIFRAGPGLVGAVPLIVVSYLLWSNVAVGNFVAFVLVASVLMARCLNRGQNVLAGVCWALAMIKPQSAILFAVPLLMRRKWTACFAAVATCILASLVPLAMCKTSLVDLLVQGPAANAELFLGCGTYPRFLLGLFGNSVEIGIGLCGGLILCCVMTIMVRREDDWFLLLMPAAVCGASWTYTQAYSHAMCWFLAFVIVRELSRNPRSQFLWTVLGLSAFFLSRWLLAWHGLCVFAGWRFPLSEYAFRCVDSLNSTVSLLLAFALCAWIWRRGRDAVCYNKGIHANP